MKKRKSSMIPNMDEMKRHVRSKGRVIRALYIFLSVLVIFTLIRSFVRREYFNVMVCLLTLALFMLPAIVEKNFKLRLPRFFEGIVLVFIFSAEILGEINSYYQRIPHWDTVLHTVNGFMFAAFGFALLDMINRDRNIKFKLSPFYLALVAFCFSMTVGVVWEFYEFGADMIFHTDMQKDTYIADIYTVSLDDAKTNTVIPVEKVCKVVLRGEDGGETVLPAYLDIGLIDTMKDLMVNFIGAFVFSIIGYFFVKEKGEGKFAKQFIPQLQEADKTAEDGDPMIPSSQMLVKKD
jgi:hypothetical protein